MWNIAVDSGKYDFDQMHDLAERIARVRFEKKSYEYYVTTDSEVRDKKIVQDSFDVAAWLNQMDERGWEFVGSGVKFWHDILPQQWWIFRREK